MRKFNGIDYLNIESLLTEDEKMVRDSVREFVDAEIIPIIEDNYQHGTFPKELVKKLAELGVFGIKENESERVAALIVPSKLIKSRNTPEHAKELLQIELVKLGN